MIKMKKQILVFVLTICSLVAYCQDKATLTKEETINYLRKKCQEVVGFSRVINKYGESNKVTKADISIDDCTITYTSYTKDVALDIQTSYPIKYSFNAKDISNIYVSKELYGGGSAGIIEIYLTNQTGLRTVIGQGGPVATMRIEINFLAADVTNFDKIRKALEHIKALCKAEDDPFGN